MIYVCPLVYHQKQDYGLKFPSQNELTVSHGQFYEKHHYKASTTYYLVTATGQKIYFDSVPIIGKDVLDFIENKEVKVSWFLLKSRQIGMIAQIDCQNKTLISKSYSEKEWLRMKHSKLFVNLLVILGVLTILMIIFELIIQATHHKK